MTDDRPILVLGGTGKTGSRVIERLSALGVPTRSGSRSAEPPFDWNERSTWGPALEGVRSVYVSYYPDIAMPGAVDAVGSFAQLAVSSGVKRLVLLAGRGEEEAERAEEAVRATGADLTIVRATWFAQNWSEGFWIDYVHAGEVTLPVAEVPEPFVDVDDIADVAVAALTDDRHIGKLYELTGPRLITFADAVAEIAEATGRPIKYTPVSVDEHAAEARAQGVPEELVELMTYLFSEVLDGRNAHVEHGVEGALGRPAKDFSDFVRETAASGAWDPARVGG